MVGSFCEARLKRIDKEICGGQVEVGLHALPIDSAIAKVRIDSAIAKVEMSYGREAKAHGYLHLIAAVLRRIDTTF
jgi:hypothetical protein